MQAYLRATPSRRTPRLFLRTRAPAAGSHSPAASAGSLLPPSRQATARVPALPPDQCRRHRASSPTPTGNAGPIPSSRPICLKLTPSARRRRISDTASFLNSALNVRFARGGAPSLRDDRLTEHLRITYGEVSTKTGQLQSPSVKSVNSVSSVRWSWFSSERQNERQRLPRAARSQTMKSSARRQTH